MINLEKIDAVIAATGADYATVRQVLLATDGDIAASIRMILNSRHDQDTTAQESADAYSEGSQDQSQDQSQSQKDRQHFNYQDQLDDIVSVIKEIWRTGNASSLIVEKNGRTVLNLSLTVSAFILIITPLISIIGLGTAIITEYTIKIQMVNGEIIDVLEYSLKHGGGRRRYDTEANKDTDQSTETDENEETETK